MHPEKRSRECKLCDTYRIVALYRICRFAHLHTAYNDTSLLEHREVKRSRSIMHKHYRTCELCVSYASCMSLFGIVLHAVHVIFTCYARAVHVLCVRTGSNRIEPRFPRNVSRCMSLFGIVLHAVHVMFTCYARVVRQNRFKPVQTSSNWKKNQEKSSRECKLCDTYRIVALYRELFDVCRFASTPTYRL